MGDMDRVTVLDGGLSTALEERGADLGGALWTARLLGEEPERIAEAHRAFYRAGAQVATTASYQVSVEGLVAAGYDEAGARGPDHPQRDPRPARSATSWRTPAPGCWSPPRSGRTARSSPTGRSTAAATASPPPGCATSTPRGWSCSPPPDRTCSPSRRSPTATRPRCWCRCSTTLGLPAWFSYSVAGPPPRPASRWPRRTPSWPAAPRRSPRGRQLLRPGRRARCGARRPSR